ncbi:MAG: hypothetical protein JWM34_2092 [Ilumatobacteraceae bacterium]|nr:hypothetical protein [Ilumatobacteraceae bacterium]
MKITHKIGAAAITAVIAVGGTTAAFAASGSGSGSGSADGTMKAARIAVLCEHQDEIVPKLTERQTNVNERISTLQELEAKATAAGKTKAADRIEQRITTLQTRVTKVGTRLDKAPAWIAANCTTTPTTTAATTPAG